MPLKKSCTKYIPKEYFPNKPINCVALVEKATLDPNSLMNR